MPPIKPSEVAKKKLESIPEGVFEVFNKLITTKYDGYSAHFTQDEVVKALCSLGFNREEIFKDNLLDVEAAYEAAGWKVGYDKPGYCETYSATFIFEKKRYGC